jgi:transposase
VIEAAGATLRYLPKYSPDLNPIEQRWSHFLRQPAKVDSPIQRTIHHEDAETVFG